MGAISLINQAHNDLNLSFQLLERGDIRDAAEKAWRAIENTRKALLVAVKIPYEIAKTITSGVPLFSKILKAIGKKSLLRMYFYFDSRLHTLGFYEMITPEEELEDIIRNEVPEWIEEMEKIINSIKHIDFITSNWTHRKNEQNKTRDTKEIERVHENKRRDIQANNQHITGRNKSIVITETT